jgi:hypothetical protein
MVALHVVRPASTPPAEAQNVTQPLDQLMENLLSSLCDVLTAW